MARTVDQQHRDELARAVADRLLVTGDAREPLRGIAERVGTSARMLVHHFGTREALIDAALEVARADQLEHARAAIVPGPDAVAVLEATWRWFRRSDTRRYFVLFTAVAALERAVPESERRFTQRLGSEWRPIFEAVFAADARFAARRRPLAQLVIGVLRGFSLDLTDGAADRAHRAAWRSFLDLLEPQR